jgi:2-methylcitrate dehydratase PrpD
VVLTATDGRTLERTVIDPKGTTADPLSFDEVGAKFARLTALVKIPQAIEHVRLAARELATMPTLERLSYALREGTLDH